MLKKVLVISSVHPWNDTRIFHRQVQSLVKLGYQVYLIAIETNKKCGKDTPYLKQALLKRKKLILRWQHFRQVLKKIKQENPDVIHLHDPELLFLVPRIRKISQAKIIFDMHEDFPAALASKQIAGMPFKPSWIEKYKHYEKRRLQQVDGLIYAEKYYKELYCLPEIKQVDILNYPHLVKHSKSNKFQRFTMVYAGAIHEIRGLKEMLELTYRLHQKKYNIQLILIGKVPSHLEDYVVTFIQENALEDVVLLKGRLDYTEVQKYYERSHLGLALLHSEPNYLGSLPTKLFEYMAFQLPFLASDFPKWASMIHENKSGLAVPYNHLDIVEAKTEELIKNVIKRKIMANNGYLAHRNHFNWQNEEQKLAQFYKEVIGEQ